MPRRVLKLDRKGKPRMRANEAQVLYGLVERFMPMLPKYQVAVVVERKGNVLYTTPEKQLAKVIANALKKPITEEERELAQGRTTEWGSNPDVVEAKQF